MATVLDIDIGYRIKSRTGVYYRNLQFLGSGANSVVYRPHGAQLAQVCYLERLQGRDSRPQTHLSLCDRAGGPTGA